MTQKFAKSAEISAQFFFQDVGVREWDIRGQNSKQKSNPSITRKANQNVF